MTAESEPLAAESKASPRVPRWLVRTIWFLHRRIYAVTGGRFGLRPAADRQWGMLRLESVGRRSGRTRLAILGYVEDGSNVVVPAMNGWADPEPAWWLNLQANPEATIELPGGTRRRVIARAAAADERNRLWRRLVDLGSSAYTEANAATRSRETSIVVLEPAPGA
jgi:deazaflavin-dependent oxidoreductase (nitroreductase family)